MKTQSKKHLISAHIAGFTYYDGVDVVNTLKVGDQLTLEIEPENKHDSNAVAIYFGEAKLGYLPRKLNFDIHTLLEYGYAAILDTKIQQINLNDSPENQIGFVVRLKDKNSALPDLIGRDEIETDK